jgi:Domain of unknown function (DUF5979)/Thioester domain
MRRVGSAALFLRRPWRVPVILALALGAFLLQAAPAGAVFRPGPPPTRPTLRGNTEMTMSGTGPGQGVTGYIANPSNPFNPVTDPYPSTTPPPDFTAKDEGFAGIIYGTPIDGPPNSLRLYCIDINTNTWGGIGYALGTWDASGVPNVGYVAQLLNSYYPHTDEPAALTNLNQKAAAVQAAIWFFSDRYVLSTSDPLYSYVVAIVNDVKAKGPLVQPPPPSLMITPSHVSAPARVLGPFTVTTDHPPATVTAAGGTMYSNRAGTTLLGDGTMATVPSGQKIWLRAARGASTAVLQAVSTATVPSGNVYLYDGNTLGVNDAQRLILAETTTLKTTVQATAEFLPFGSLVVKKTIGGPAASHQGPVVIRVNCDDGVTSRPFVIPAGAHAGTRSRTYRFIEAGTRCTVIETSNGSTTTTTVVVRGDGRTVTILTGKTETVRITDIYRFVPGSLLVRKTIAGPAAGQQGEIRIHTVCNGKALSPDFVIDAGASQGDYTKQYDGIPVPARCTVTETADGHTSTVSVIVEGSGQTVPIGPGDVVEADISDTYGLVPGQLEVTKTIAGPAAGSQGEVVIHTVCNGTALTPDFVIAPGAPAGVQSHVYSGLAAGATCVVTETADGATSAVSVVVAGSPHTTTVPAGGAGAATITDTYSATPGSLLVTKTIAGPLAGHQGPVTIHVVCDGVALSPDFVIAAGTAAGNVSHTFDGIPAGSVCTVTETADGATATVTATVSGDGQTVTVPAGKVVPVSLMDVYDDAMEDVYDNTAGSLTVTKTIAGPAARQHGPIAILVACGGPLNDFSFVIPAHTGPGSSSRHFDGIPAGSRCTVTETADGHTNTLAVVATGGRTVTIPARGRASVHITDRFTIKPPAPLVTG